MSHFTRELADPAYYRGMKIPHLLVRNIDEKTKKAVTSSGGTWAPVTPIIIAGAGLELQSSLVMTGTAKAAPAVGSSFIFGDDDYFKFGAPISRTIVVSPVYSDVRSHPMHFFVANSFNVGAPVVTNVFFNLGTDVLPPSRARFFRCPLHIPDGSILTSLTVSFSVHQGGNRVLVPQYMPRMRVARIAPDGTITQYPGGTTSGIDPDGWCSPARPASAAAWVNSNNIQTLALTFDANGAPADRSAYDYAFEYFDESGLNATYDNRIHFLTMVVKQSDLRPY